MTTESKFSLRKKFREIRSKISPKYREEAAIESAKVFATLNFFYESMAIACYLPFKDEFDSLPIIETIWKAKKDCYLPVLAKDEKHLLFAKYSYGDALHLNRFSILEPSKITNLIEPQNLDLVVTPLLAFDKKGNRLGTGGGYYDQTFAFVRDEKASIKPRMIGLGFAAQEADNLPEDPWDVVLTGVVTEQIYINCKH